MADEGYNGWRNYETWLLKLNVDNDEGLQNYVNDIAREYITRNSVPDECDLGDLIQESLEELFWNDEFQIYKICDNWTTRDWQEIYWREIAEAYIEDNEGGD